MDRAIRTNEGSAQARTVYLRLRNADKSPKNDYSGGAKVSINGGTFNATTHNPVLVSNGYYYLILEQGEVNVAIGSFYVARVDDDATFFCIPATGTIVAAGAYSEPVDGSTLATGTAVTAVAGLVTKLLNPTASEVVALQQAQAAETLVTFNGKRGHKILIDKEALLAKVIAPDNTTVLSSEPIVLDDAGNIISIG